MLIPVSAYSEIPSDIEFTDFVSDKAGIFSESDLVELQKVLSNIEKETTNEIAVAAVNNLGGMRLEDFSLDVASRNYLGKPVKNNGLLILLAIEDRKARIVVGYGFEIVITDQIAASIMQEILIPHFKKEKYTDGVFAGVKAIKSYLYQDDVKQYFSMPWDIINFEAFIEKYPDSGFKCDSYMFLGRFYEDLWNKKWIKSFGEDNRKRSIENYQRYMEECPDGMWSATVEHELTQVKLKKPDSRKYLDVH